MDKSIFKKNVLVTGVGGDIGQGIIKCLIDVNYATNLYGCDLDKYAAGRKLVKDFFISPSIEVEENYIEFLSKIIKDKNIEYIVPSSEVEIKLLGKYRKLEIFKNVNILINNQLILDTFLDKYKTIIFFEQNKIMYPKTYLIEEFKEQLPFPVILKLREGAGRKGFFIVNNNEDLIYFKRNYKKAIIQEIVGDIDHEYTIGVFSDGKRVNSIGFRRYLGYGSLSKYVEIENDIKIQELAEKIASITNLKGSINIQTRKVNGIYIPFEINPRLSSTIYFRNYFGFQDLKWWIDINENIEIEYKPRCSKGIGIKTVGEVFFEL
ncbi:ATP-grasp domain-containing protein [Clostridium botulinum]|uniref:ATP-grasp domain-containing protein n=1 Tax=Clostridium TaxID=1485 RepID=UPI0013F6D386|nr:MULTISPECIES: ATP-grasp domain-containing protein [Clostridium]MCS6131032.1 ATP-grasp domain-containing protein [Clostridium botulinum]NFL43796.1 ATP-grasp domain-containing protein [Clostridium botulinum]NFL88767.1 ATP-grasp domain-containing protein [Clostridium botulinum]